MALAILANKHSRDETYESPYSREAIQQGLDLPWWKKILGKKLTGKGQFRPLFSYIHSASSSAERMLFVYKGEMPLA
jgi:hypothetical protein